MNVTGRWRGKRQFETAGPSGHVITLDAKRGAGGEGEGNRPMELLLMGLIGCTGIDITMILERMRESYEDVQIDAEGTRSVEFPQKFTEIHLTYKFTGPISPRKAWRAVHLSQEKYCSVAASLNANIIPHLIINGQAIVEE